MSLSLKDQLIAAGLVKKDAPSAPKNAPVARSAVAQKSARPNHAPPKHASASQNKAAAPAKTSSEPSLAALYQARSQAEAAEAAERKRLAQQKEREAIERKRAVRALIDGKDLQRKDAEIARHFEYGKKIRRMYLHADQREALNIGKLGIVQMEGKFYLLDSAIVEQVKVIAPQFVALLGASSESDVMAEQSTYQDSRFQVPDDLMW